MLKRLIYLAYYFKETDWGKLKKFIYYVCENYNYSKAFLLGDMLWSSLKYNISPLDFFYFHFFEKGKEERLTYAGTGYMYEYQLKMNPKKTRNILENKLLFNEYYEDFIKHKYWKKTDILADTGNLNMLPSKIIFKSTDGQCGEGVQVIEVGQEVKQKVLDLLKTSKNDLLEEYIIQHDELMHLSPSGLNTVRIFTQLNSEGSVDYLGARLRISVNSNVDNLAAGNIAAPIDLKTGKITGPAVYSDITMQDVMQHPVTEQKIIGFQIPYWDEVLNMTHAAALLYPENRSIGWDVAITNDGPELLEGNHNWCKLLWQLPVKKGLKKDLEKYL